MSTASTLDTAAPVATVRDYIAAFNRGDANSMAALCADPMSILDGMAPHVWHGPTATQDWYRDVLVEGEHLGARDYFVELGEPRHANITGDNAYVVVPTTMTFKLQGKQITQTGAIFTVALRRAGDEWRIAAWAWAKGTAQANA
jgi:ketosteroid isomerase-like protein